MNAFEWASRELRHYQHEERAAVERVKAAEENLAKAKTELDLAHAVLAGARGGMAEFTWQINYLEEHGTLP